MLKLCGDFFHGWGALLAVLTFVVPNPDHSPRGVEAVEGFVLAAGILATEVLADLADEADPHAVGGLADVGEFFFGVPEVLVVGEVLVDDVDVHALKAHGLGFVVLDGDPVDDELKHGGVDPGLLDDDVGVLGDGVVDLGGDLGDVGDQLVGNDGGMKEAFVGEGGIVPIGIAVIEDLEVGVEGAVGTLGFLEGGILSGEFVGGKEGVGMAGLEGLDVGDALVHQGFLLLAEFGVLG